MLGLVILALVPVVPFTEQFAKESTPQAYWSSPTFIKINRVLSAAWGTAIFLIGVSRVAAAAIGAATAFTYRRLVASGARHRRRLAALLVSAPGGRTRGRRGARGHGDSCGPGRGT